VENDRRAVGRIRVQGQYYLFSLDEPFQWLPQQPPGLTATDTKELREFVRRNRTVLIDYWKGDISTVDLVAGLRKID